MAYLLKEDLDLVEVRGYLIENPIFHDEHGYAFCNFAIEVNIDDDQSYFVRIHTIGRTAVACKKYLKKGMEIEVGGSRMKDSEMDGINAAYVRLLGGFRLPKPEFPEFLTEEENSVLAHQIIHAAVVGDINTVKKYLEHGGDIDARDSQGRTALMFASWGRQVEMVELLLDAGANRHLKTTVGNTALDFAKKGDSKEIINLLMQIPFPEFLTEDWKKGYK